MADREEFDWARMRREEDVYWAVRETRLRTLGQSIDRIVNRTKAAVLMPDDEAERLAWLRLIPYSEYLETPEWKRTRERILVRDGRSCRRCMSRKNVQVHHLTYERRGRERDEDLITLCRRCHELAHEIVAE